jgi:hypothetical protein
MLLVQVSNPLPGDFLYFSGSSHEGKRQIGL